MFKVWRVPRRKCGMTSKDDSRDHRVPQFHGAALLVPRGHQFTGVLRGWRIEGSNSSPQFVN